MWLSYFLTTPTGLLIELGIHYDPIRDNHPKDTFIKQFTFNSKRKSMSTVIPLPDNKGYRLLTKGASEIILSKCTHLMTANGTVRLDHTHILLWFYSYTYRLFH